MKLNCNIAVLKSVSAEYFQWFVKVDSSGKWIKVVFQIRKKFPVVVKVEPIFSPNMKLHFYTFNADFSRPSNLNLTIRVLSQSQRPSEYIIRSTSQSALFSWNFLWLLRFDTCFAYHIYIASTFWTRRVFQHGTHCTYKVCLKLLAQALSAQI